MAGGARHERHRHRARSPRRSEVGICGEAPSNHPEFAEMLVQRGIDSISVSPDRLLQVKSLVNAVEARQA
ncbi:MAG TPA: putative PEP-binding protein [Acidimicrobiales bacterium]